MEILTTNETRYLNAVIDAKPGEPLNNALYQALSAFTRLQGSPQGVTLFLLSWRKDGYKPTGLVCYDADYWHNKHIAATKKRRSKAV